MWCGGVAKSGIAVWRKRRCGELLVWRKLRRDGVAETAVWRVLRTAVWRKSWMLRCGENGGAAVLRKADAVVWQNCCPAELRCCWWRSVGLALLVCIRSTSRADSVLAGPTARSCDQLSPKLAADCDGAGDFRGESFRSPVFSGVYDENLA
jgi:hypothetical protein